MIKTLTSYLDYGLFAEIALVIFAIVFISIVIRTLMTNRAVCTEHARIVLDDSKETN